MSVIPVAAAAAGPLVAGVSVVAADGDIQPWWIAVIVVPLAGFSAWLVHWILERQDQRDKVLHELEVQREKTEEKRAEAAWVQAHMLQECVVELRRLHQLQAEATRVLAEMPARVVDEIEDRRPK